MEIDEEYQRILSIVEEKDGVIRNLEEQVHTLMNETRKLTLRDQSQSKDYNSKSPISLNINVKPSNTIES